MKKLLRRWLSIDDIIEYQKQQACGYEEVCQRLLQIEGKIGFHNDLPEKVEFLQDNTIRLNAMMLELKGVVATARAMIDQGKTKPPLSDMKNTKD